MKGYKMTFKSKMQLTTPMSFSGSGSVLISMSSTGFSVTSSNSVIQTTPSSGISNMFVLLGFPPSNPLSFDPDENDADGDPVGRFVSSPMEGSSGGNRFKSKSAVMSSSIGDACVINGCGRPEIIPFSSSSKHL